MKIYQKMSYTGGTKSFAPHKDEETRSRTDGSIPTQADLFILTHTKKDGKAVDDSSEEITDETCDSIGDDIYIQVMGPERHGRVCGYGLGPTPTSVFGSTSSQFSAQYRGMHTQLDDMRQQMEGLKTKHSEEMQMQREENQRQLEEMQVLQRVQEEMQRKQGEMMEMGVLADILEPIMGKGLIPGDLTLGSRGEEDQMSNCQSFGSNYHPCSQSRKISIGVVVDTSAILRSGPIKDDKTALPNSGKLAASGGKLIKDKDKGSGVIASEQQKQTEFPK
ncbi:hypothetical protein HHK36_024120 [Tetracentron sinense]|uniref:Meiosis-specific protein ASY3-like coiled-coil domain-containing protein n=1 Tax=Tetracentron sinense TaxID=13715 RepID=A0A834YPX7_TETSI|nr:hypothetical protein HHK36_024120 [Tetracentron sinense]